MKNKVIVKIENQKSYLVNFLSPDNTEKTYARKLLSQYDQLKKKGLIDLRFPHYAKVLFSNLLDKMGYKHYAFPSLERLSQELECSLSSVMRAKNWLIEKGFIQLSKINTIKGKTNLYRLTNKLSEDIRLALIKRESKLADKAIKNCGTIDIMWSTDNSYAEPDFAYELTNSSATHEAPNDKESCSNSAYYLSHRQPNINSTIKNNIILLEREVVSTEREAPEASPKALTQKNDLLDLNKVAKEMSDQNDFKFSLSDKIEDNRIKTNQSGQSMNLKLNTLKPIADKKENRKISNGHKFFGVNNFSGELEENKNGIENFTPNDSSINLAKQLNKNYDFILKKFKIFYADKKFTDSRWQSKFRMWIANEKNEFNDMLTHFPQDFEPSEENIHFAMNIKNMNKVQFDETLMRFKKHNHGIKYHDWQHRLKGWLDRYMVIEKGPSLADIKKCIVPDYIPTPSPVTQNKKLAKFILAKAKIELKKINSIDIDGISYTKLQIEEVINNETI